MIEIIQKKPYKTEKTWIENYYQDSDHHFTVILGEPHQIVFQDQTFTLDFSTPTYQALIGPKHPLISAIGKQPQKVLDAFGGLGKDGFILAHFGHDVTTYEINPILYLLLSQALDRYPGHNLSWTIQLGDVSDHLSGYDVIYFDPMFELNTSAKPKLALQVIQNIILDQTFSSWDKALHSAQKKLVIKQHITNPPEPSLPKPSTQIKGKKNVRYDIYYR